LLLESDIGSGRRAAEGGGLGLGVAASP
jgi:hypothetical protein